MGWIIIVVGAILTVLGGAVAYSGLDYVQVERGWTAVIAGTTLLSGGVLTAAIGALVLRLNAILKALPALAALATQGAEIKVQKASEKPAESLHVAVIGEPSVIETPPAVEHVDSPEGMLKPPVAEPAKAEFAPVLAGATVLAGAATATVLATSSNASSVLAKATEDLQHELANFDLPKPELKSPELKLPELTLPRAANPVAAANIFAPKPVAPAPLADMPEVTPVRGAQIFIPEAPPGEEAGIDPFSLMHEPADLPPPVQIEAAAPLPLSHPATSTDMGSLDWLEDAISGKHEPQITTPVAPALNVEPVHAAAPHPHDMAKPAEPPRSPALDAAPSVVGRYEAAGTSYAMYSDGSVEAENDHGIFRFASMAELREFIESGQSPEDHKPTI